MLKIIFFCDAYKSVDYHNNKYMYLFYYCIYFIIYVILLKLTENLPVILTTSFWVTIQFLAATSLQELEKAVLHM